MCFNKVVEGDETASSCRGPYQRFGDRGSLSASEGPTLHPIAESGLRHPEVAGGRQEGVRRGITNIGGRCGAHMLVDPLEVLEGLPPWLRMRLYPNGTRTERATER